MRAASLQHVRDLRLVQLTLTVIIRRLFMRTTTGVARNRSKNRLFKRAKGYRGGRGKLTRTVKETLLRSGAYAFRDRRRKKREFRRLWIIRINLQFSCMIYGTASLFMA